MQGQDFTVTIFVDQSPKKVFDAITDVRGWWSKEVQGGTRQLNDEFHYHYRDVHSCTMQLTAVVPEQKIVWLVRDNYFNFVKDQEEWKGTHVIFDISQKNGQTQLQFTHQGLIPQHECYAICHDAWTRYITKSLRNLIEMGKGEPNARE